MIDKNYRLAAERGASAFPPNNKTAADVVQGERDPATGPEYWLQRRLTEQQIADMAIRPGHDWNSAMSDGPVQTTDPLLAELQKLLDTAAAILLATLEVQDGLRTRLFGDRSPEEAEEAQRPVFGQAGELLVAARRVRDCARLASINSHRLSQML